MTVYTTPEGSLVVELCAIVYEPNMNGPTPPRPFVLSFVTSDGTAGKAFKLSEFCCITKLSQLLERTTFLLVVSCPLLWEILKSVMR